MEAIAALLVQQALLALFLVIAAGYAIGAIDLKGFSLGVGAVLFSGLAVGRSRRRHSLPRSWGRSAS